MKKALFLLAAATVMAACTMTNPITANTTNITGVDLTDSSIRTGEDCATYVLGFIGPFGDSNLVEAAKNGNIRDIKYADLEGKNYVLFTQRCTVVYGK